RTCEHPYREMIAHAVGEESVDIPRVAVHLSGSTRQLDAGSVDLHLPIYLDFPHVGDAFRIEATLELVTELRFLSVERCAQVDIEYPALPWVDDRDICSNDL